MPYPSTGYYVSSRLQSEEAKGVTVVIPRLQSQSKEEPVANESAEQPKVQEKLPTKEETVGDNVIEEVKSVGNRFLSIQVLSTKRSPAKVPPHAEHPVEGSRVSMKPASVDAAVKELESATEKETSATLAKPHKSIRATLDKSLFQDLDQMRAAELIVRVVQLATQIEERTKSEAVPRNSSP
jgi:NADPH-dependent glutamate synthase beta subunit-like oxidoreductase